MARKVIILKGLPASGKSTWAKQKVLESQGSYKRVNKDDLRDMIDGGKWSKGNEKFVLTMRNSLIWEALRDGKNVIVDDTNLAPKHEDDIRCLVEDFGDANNCTVTVEVKTFDTSVDECIERDLKREKSVGADVIIKMARQWSPDGEYSAKGAIPELDLEEFARNELPGCVIFDLDGTAAIMGDRSPYDASRCDEIDRPNHPLLLILYALRIENPDMRLIAMSGRSSEYRDATLRFLNKHKIQFDDLYMRAKGDNRKDAVIKGELYEEHVKGKYNVVVVFDDRNQMVDYWRQEAGVPCFQVNYGDF